VLGVVEFAELIYYVISDGVSREETMYVLHDDRVLAPKGIKLLVVLPVLYSFLVELAQLRVHFEEKR